MTHELLIAKFKLKWKKVRKATGPFRCDLNQIPYDYTVEVRNRFMGLNLTECLMNYGWRFTTMYRRQESKLDLLYCRQIVYHLATREAPSLRVM